MTSFVLTAHQAAQGVHGILEEVRDYRAAPVLAYISTIAGSSWLMIAKIDQREAEARVFNLTLFAHFSVPQSCDKIVPRLVPQVIDLKIKESIMGLDKNCVSGPSAKLVRLNARGRYPDYRLGHRPGHWRGQVITET